MTEEIKNLWAKKREENGRLLWLPLMQHLEDTKNIMAFLWEQWLSQGQKNLIKDSLEPNRAEEIEGKKLACFLAAVHDIGKATPAFQTKKSFSKSSDLDEILLEKLERVGFNGISTLHLESPSRSPHTITGQYLLETFGVSEELAAIIGGHHGKPVDDYSYRQQGKSYPSNCFQVEKEWSPIHKKWKSCQQNIFQWALKQAGFDSVEQLPNIKQPAQVILSGLLIMADWIASNEHFFPLLDIDKNEVTEKDERRQFGVEKWKRTSMWVPKTLINSEKIYQQRFGQNFTPRNFQKVLFETMRYVKNPGIVILEAPMGLGKTEAALITAEQLADKTDRSGVFFGLPTQATSNGIFKRIEKWVESISEDFEDTLSIQLVHGKAALNDDFLSLPKGNTINIDDLENGSVVVNEWFSGRKTAALDDFVVGTVDQFLRVALKQKHLALRHLGFSRKVVIIDEVHAYDAYMSQYLLEAIQWMGAYGVPVIILSATLPIEQRENMLKSYMAGKGIKWTAVENRHQLQKDAYPLITYSDGKNLKQVNQFEEMKEKKVDIIRLDEEDLSQTVANLVKSGGVIGVIVNTVKKAQHLTQQFSELFGEEQVDLVHSGFIATERMKKENYILHQIGKNAKRPFSKIIVGTQVIEQSLDIDFDVLISDLAPMDLLIQRMGRLQRHEDTKRPAQHTIARFYVMGTSNSLEFEEGSSFIYGDCLLARTQYFLLKQINLPGEISTLVQKVYDWELELEFSDDSLREKYLETKEKHQNQIISKRTRANGYKISNPILKDTKCSGGEANLISWLKNDYHNDSEESVYAQVRDTEETIEVIALKRVGNGYGLFGENRDISEEVSNSQIAKIVAQNTLRLPSLLTRSYNIDETIRYLEKYTKEVLREWEELPWLKGALAIIFDEENSFIFNSYKLIYHEKYGIKIERMDESESV